MSKQNKNPDQMIETADHFQIMEQQITHGCLFLVIFLGLIYLVFVLFFWMIGGVTHRSSVQLENLRAAETPEEIRDELVNRFGRFHFKSIESITDQAKEAASDKVQSAVTDTVNEQIDAKIESAVDLNQ